MTPRWPSLSKFGHRIVFDDARWRSINANLSSVILDEAWNWGYARFDELVTTQSKLPWIFIGECDKSV